MPEDDTDTDETPLVRYRIDENVFEVPDDHDQIVAGDEPEYVAPHSGLIERLDGADVITVLDWEYEPSEQPEYQAPPEVVVSDEGRRVGLVPSPDGAHINQVGFDEVQCQRCDAIVGIPGLRDGELQTPVECPSCDRKSSFTLPNLPPQYSTEDVLDAVPPEKIWKPPSGVEKASPSQVWDDVYEHIHRHWDAGGEDSLYTGLTAYAISTWFRDQLDFVPHLLLIGPHETGKTRLLNTLREVSYRAVNSASASPASIYRSIDQYDCTMYLSEYHDLPDEVQDQVDAVIKMGQKRGEIALRSEEVGGGGYTVAGFEPFTHAAISTQFDIRDDIRSRCFEIKTKPSKRNMPRTVEDRADLRNKLLYLRFRYLYSEEWDEARSQAELYMDDHDLFGRISEKIWPLLTVANLADRSIEEFVGLAVQKAKVERSESEEAIFIQAVIDVAYQELQEINYPEYGTPDGDIWSDLSIQLSLVTDQFNKLTGRDVSNQYMGQLRNRLGLGKERSRDGIHLSDDNLYQKLRRLADEHNVDWEPTAGVNDDIPGFRSMTQGERRDQILNAVDDLATPDVAPPISKVVSTLEGQGYDPEVVRDDIDKLLEDGTLYRDGPETVRLSHD